MMGVDTTNFWIIDFVINLALNLSKQIHDIFVVDIAHCYEAIPLEVGDNMMDAISKLISYAYYQIEHPSGNRIEHPKSEQKLIMGTIWWD